MAKVPQNHRHAFVHINTKTHLKSNNSSLHSSNKFDFSACSLVLIVHSRLSSEKSDGYVQPQRNFSCHSPSIDGIKITKFFYTILLESKVPQNPAFAHINTITHPSSNNSGVNEGVNDSLIKFWYKIRLFCLFVSIDSSLSAIVGEE